MSVKMFRLLAAILAVAAMGTVLSGCALFPTEEEAKAFAHFVLQRKG